MTIKERKRQMRVVAEVLLVHVPALLKSDPSLARDMLAVAGKALQSVHEDAEQSAKAWDKRAYHVKADALRREWGWVQGAANYATGLALRSKPLTAEGLANLEKLIGLDLEKPYRRQISDPERFRGAARMLKAQREARRPPIRR